MLLRDIYEIKTLGRQGDGVADGPIYVPRALPGEHVEGVVEDGRIASPKIVRPVAERIAAPCRHFKSCGGCTLQHANDDFVQNWKRSVVEEALRSQAIDPPVRSEVLTSPAQSRRRAKITARRTKTGAIAGFYGTRSHALIDVQSCELVTPGVAKGFELARAVSVLAGSRRAEISVFVTDLPDGLDVNVEGAKPLDGELRVKLPSLARRCGCVRLTWEGELVAQSAPARAMIGQAWVELPPGAFLQVTKDGEIALQSHVAEIVKGARRVADLFSGCGTFALKLAEKARVTAVEGDSSMVAALQVASNSASDLHPIKVHARDLFRDPLPASELSNFDAIVLDPPRAGASAQCIEIAKSDVPVLAYVSCSPESFARDAATLIRGGYRLDWVQVVDQFRWSAHIELVAQLTHLAINRKPK